MRTPTTAPYAAADGRLLGEVITWACTGAVVRHADLIDALRAAGFKVEAYAQYLAEVRERRERDLAQARFFIGQAKPVGLVASTSVCRTDAL